MLELRYDYQDAVEECKAFSDSDWAGDYESRQSTVSAVEKLGNHCVVSVCEAEVGRSRILCTACREQQVERYRRSTSLLDGDVPCV